MVRWVGDRETESSQSSANQIGGLISRAKVFGAPQHYSTLNSPYDTGTTRKASDANNSGGLKANTVKDSRDKMNALISPSVRNSKPGEV